MNNLTAESFCLFFREKFAYVRSRPTNNMQTENWKNIKDVLLEVLNLDSPEDRRRYLENVGPATREEVESLLAFEEESEGLMRLSAVEFSKDFFENGTDQNPLIGQRVGVYRIVRELGQGGMGAVYLAERADGKFEQKVALKLLKREMNTSALRRRFQQERSILASLEHPNIARLLDAGTTDDQIPFIAMEYVEGLPIDEFCNKNNYDLSRRLDLFRKVCAAVNFAHRNLIVHRDLKPSNILVGDDGNPKLLDFGISKILSAEFEPLNAATVTSLGAMTPAYASPEQLQSKSVTTATDIYSLGIILYELLSNHRPFENKENDLKAIYKAVLETDPLPPSALVGTDFKAFKKRAEAAAEIQTEKDYERKIQGLAGQTKANKSRYTIPDKNNLNPNSLHGDLDNIVLKALRKEPERRYLSAENFAEDIHRHQRGLPVTARPNTFSYRAEKFIKRNQVGVIAGILILLAIIGGIAATLWQARVARAERAKAEKRFNDVRALANSFLFELNPKIENLPGSIPAREFLVRRALEYLDGLSTEAGDDAELQEELATAYEKVGDLQGNPFNPNVGDVKGAMASFGKAETIRRNLLEKNPVEPRTMDALANNFKSQGSLHSLGGNYSRAGELYKGALDLQEKVVEKSPQDFNFRWNLADLVRYNGFIEYTNEQHKAAVKLYSRSISIYETLVREQPDNHRLAESRANVFVSMGESQGWDSDFQSAAINLQKGLEMLLVLREKNPHDRHLQRSLVVAYGKRGENLIDLEDYATAADYYLKSIELAQNALDADPLDKQAQRDLALQYKKLATGLNAMGKNDESVKNMLIALKIFRELAAADPNNTETIYDAANVEGLLSVTYLSMRRFETALEISRRAIENYDIALKLNPEKDYIKAQRAYGFKSLGRSYLGLAEKNDRRENLRKGLENLQIAFEDLTALNQAGRLNQFDVPYLEALGKQIEEVKSQIGES